MGDSRHRLEYAFDDMNDEELPGDFRVTEVNRLYDSNTWRIAAHGTINGVGMFVYGEAESVAEILWDMRKQIMKVGGQIEQ